MPTVSVFLGIIIRMYWKEHNPPHFHVYYQGQEGIFDIQKCEKITGNMPKRQTKYIEARAGFHKDELLANWDLVENGEALTRIAPLKF